MLINTQPTRGWSLNESDFKIDFKSNAKNVCGTTIYHENMFGHNRQESDEEMETHHHQYHNQLP